MEEIELKFPRFENEESMSETEICLACHGCCSYVTVALEYPRSRQQRDSYSWYLSHRNVEIYIDHDNVWNLLFKTPCNHMLENGVCSIYETRFDICRDYSADACSRTGSDHTHLFATPDDMIRYLNRNRSPAKKRSEKRGSGRGSMG